jgi:hypothetical protein
MLVLAPDLMTQPRKIIHIPFTKLPKIIDTNSRSIMRSETPPLTRIAVLVAPMRFFELFQMPPRKTLPPSCGKAGNKLNTHRTRMISL